MNLTGSVLPFFLSSAPKFFTHCTASSSFNSFARSPTIFRGQGPHRYLCAHQQVSRVLPNAVEQASRRRRAFREPYRNAVEQASRRWREGHDLCTDRHFRSIRAHSSATASGRRISPDLCRNQNFTARSHDALVDFRTVPDGLSLGDRPNGRASADDGARGDDPPLMRDRFAMCF